MKTTTKLNITGAIFIIIGVLGMVRGIILSVLIALIGVGLVLKNEISRIIAMIFSILGIAVISLYALALIIKIITALAQTQTILMGELILVVVFIIPGLLLYIFLLKFLKNPELKLLFHKK